MLQRDEIDGKRVTAQTRVGNPKRHTPRRKASPRVRTNDARTGAHKQGPKQPATTRNTEQGRYSPTLSHEIEPQHVAVSLSRGIRRETSWTKRMEEARYLEVVKKVRGTLERDRSNTTCSPLTSVQHPRQLSCHLLY